MHNAVRYTGDSMRMIGRTQQYGVNDPHQQDGERQAGKKARVAPARQDDAGKDRGDG